MSASHRLNAITPYFTMFPLSFPQHHLRRAHRAAWVLDPFSGRGTTNFAARLRGLPTVGVDSNPVAAAATAAKLAYGTPASVVRQARRYLRDHHGAAVPEGEFWHHAYHPDTLGELCALREGLQRAAPSDDTALLRGLALGSLHGPINKGKPSYLSNQMPRTYASKPDYAVRFWRQRTLVPARIDLLEVLERRAEYYFATLPEPVAGAGILGDSRQVDFAEAGGPFAWVITSPPYYGMRTYVSDQWLRFWFLGGPPIVPYRAAVQLDHGSPEAFARELSVVWRRVAEACSAGARLRLRFGGIRDRAADPKQLLMASLASSPWRVVRAVPAGTAAKGKRQAEQFLRGTKTRSQPVEEFDVYAVLA